MLSLQIGNLWYMWKIKMLLLAGDSLYTYFFKFKMFVMIMKNMIISL